MGRPSDLRRRVAAGLDEGKSRWTPGQATIAVSVLVTALLALPISALPPEAQAQTGPSAVTTTTDNPTTYVPRATPWSERRIAGYPLIRGRVFDGDGRPAAGVDVGRGWDAFHGEMSPTAWVHTDSEGHFEIPLISRQSPTVVMAMDRDRKNGGLLIVERQVDATGSNDCEDQSVKSEKNVIEVEIQLKPLIEVRGSYWTSEAKRRPRRVWTSVEALPEEIQVIEQNDDSPFFSFRLPPGRYRLRGNAANFDDVYRELDLEPGMEQVELPDLELPVSKLGLLYGQPAPEWHFTAGHGIDANAKLSDYRGKWVVIEFWGVWCGPCIFQMEQLFLFSEKHAADRDRFEIITLHHDLPDVKSDLDAKLPELLKKWERDEFPYPIAVDDANQTIERYGVDRFPTIVFIDPDGRVAPVNGIWGLSEILKGRDGKQPELFLSSHDKGATQPAAIRPSYHRGGAFGDSYVALNGHSDMVAAAEFFPNGKQFVTAGSDNALRFWNVETRTQTRMIRCTPKGTAYSSYGGIQLFMAQSGDLVGGYFYERSIDRLTHVPRLWRADSDFEESISLTDTSVTFGDADVSPDAKRFAAYSYDPKSKTESVRIYDLPSGTLLHALDVHGDRIHDASTGSALKFSPDGRHLAVAGENGLAIQLWDVERGQKLWQEHPADAYGINSISFSPDGETLAYATWCEPLEIRETMTGKLSQTLQAQGHRPMQVAMCPTGNYVATAGNGPHPRILIWDRRIGQVVGTLLGHPTGARAECIAWSPNGRYLVSVAGVNMRQPGEVLLWDLVENGIITVR